MWETWVLSLGQEESPGEGNGYTLQYPCLENPMDREAWWATVHSITTNWTQLKQLSTCARRKELVHSSNLSSFEYQLHTIFCSHMEDVKITELSVKVSFKA